MIFTKIVSPLKAMAFSEKGDTRCIKISKNDIFCYLRNLDYSRVEVGADARHRACSCGHPPQMPCNEADALRSARLKGKKCR